MSGVLGGMERWCRISEDVAESFSDDQSNLLGAV